MKKITRIKQQCEFSGRIISVNLETVRLPNDDCMDMEIVHHAGGSAIVAIDDQQDQQQQVCLIRQYRYALDEWIWEIPAGMIDAGETPESTAQKELQEEAGMLATDWTSLGKIYPTPGYCDEITYLYQAKDLRPTDIKHEPGEVIEVHWLAFNEAIEWALNGKINDAKTVIALLRAKKYNIAV